MNKQCNIEDLLYEIYDAHNVNILPFLLAILVPLMINFFIDIPLFNQHTPK